MTIQWFVDWLLICKMMIEQCKMRETCLSMVDCNFTLCIIMMRIERKINKNQYQISTNTHITHITISTERASKREDKCA